MNLKRAFDVVVASAVGIIVSPVVLLTGAVMTVAHGGQSPFFMQERVGKGGVCFQIIKIKSMADTFNESGSLLSEEERTTALGKFIRKTKLDELPQLLNVIKGDMSLVGPRPLPVNEIITPQRNNVPPGLTGLYQISNKERICANERLKSDLRYIEIMENCTELQRFLFDLSIVAKTPYSIIRNWQAPHYENITSSPRNDG